MRQFTTTLTSGKPVHTIALNMEVIENNKVRVKKDGSFSNMERNRLKKSLENISKGTAERRIDLFTRISDINPVCRLEYEK